MKFLEDGKVVEESSLRVRLSELEMSKVEFDKTLGHFNLEDLVCNAKDKEAIDHVINNGFSSKEEMKEFSDKYQAIQGVKFWIQEHQQEMSNLTYRLETKEEAKGALSFVNDMQELKMIRDHKEKFTQETGLFKNFFDKIGISEKSNLSNRVKALFENEAGENLSSQEVDKKEKELEEKVHKYIESTNPYKTEAKDLEDTIYEEKKKQIDAIFKDVRMSQHNGTGYEHRTLIENNDAYLEAVEVKYAEMENKIEDYKQMIKQKEQQIENIGLSEDLSNNVLNEIHFAMLTENKAHYMLQNTPSAIRSGLSDIYVATNESLMNKEDNVISVDSDMDLEEPNIIKKEEMELPNANVNNNNALKDNPTKRSFKK